VTEAKKSEDSFGSIYKRITQFFGLMAKQIHCAHILVKTEQEDKAVLERLNNGEKFANIARKVSLCPSGKRGGDLGTFGRGKIL
jgi:peptidyl-prolyl cis-trans isomerase C